MKLAAEDKDKFKALAKFAKDTVVPILKRMQSERSVIEDISFETFYNQSGQLFSGNSEDLHKSRNKLYWCTVNLRFNLLVFFPFNSEASPRTFAEIARPIDVALSHFNIFIAEVARLCK